jgi:uncharacterized protein (TIGR03437 family)
MIRKVSVIEMILLCAVCNFVRAGASAQPVVSSILNAASYDAVVSPGCLVGIFGTNLAAAPLSANVGQSPTTLGGVSVTVAGFPAPLLYVSPGQINLLIPFEVQIPESAVVPVVVTSAGGKTSYNIRLARNAPGVFTSNGSGTGRVLVFDSNFQPVDTVGSKDTVILYATGLGATSAETNSVVDEVEVYIGERKAQVLFAGLAPGLPGIYQLNVMAPAPATDRIYLRSGQWQSNIANIGIKSGANATNVKGTIDGLYPSSDPAFRVGTTASVMLHAGTFTLSLDISSGAAPFDVAAVGQAGAAVISIDPISTCINDAGIVSTGQYTASMSTVTPDAARGDFSGSIVPLWDYLTCDAESECLGFSLSTIPPARLDRLWTNAVAMLATANSITTAGPNAFSQSTGCLSDLQGVPGHLLINAQNNSLFSTFGGVTEIPLGPFMTRVSTFALYVDGGLIASKDLNYVAPNL